MFGFGKKDEKEEQKDDINWGYVEGRLGNSFGIADVDRVLKLYAPKITGEITNTLDNTVLITKNQLAIHNDLEKTMNGNQAELLKEIRGLKLQNQELQEKYNALVERMAAYIERDGRGR